MNKKAFLVNRDLLQEIFKIFLKHSAARQFRETKKMIEICHCNFLLSIVLQESWKNSHKCFKKAFLRTCLNCKTPISVMKCCDGLRVKEIQRRNISLRKFSTNTTELSKGLQPQRWLTHTKTLMIVAIIPCYYIILGTSKNERSTCSELYRVESLPTDQRWHLIQHPM